MDLVRKTLRHLLDTHEPYPALVLDSVYDIQMTNAAFRRVVAWAARSDALESYSNIYRLTFARDGLRNAVRDWTVVERFLLARLQEEAVATQHEALTDLYGEMAALGSGDDLDPADTQVDQSLPILSFALEKAGRSAAFFSTITTFGTPLDVTTQELRIESLFPADEDTRRWLLKIA